MHIKTSIVQVDYLYLVNQANPTDGPDHRIKVSDLLASILPQQTALTTQLDTVTCTAPGTPDYAIADLVDEGGFGFASLDEGLTVLKVIANLQVRVAELETKLQANNLIA